MKKFSILILLAAAVACSSTVSSQEDFDLDTELSPQSNHKKKDSGTTEDTGTDSGDEDTGTDSGDEDSSTGMVGTDACLASGSTQVTYTQTASWDPGIAADDEGVAVLSLPFSFSFYGNSYSDIWVSSNGELGFGTTPAYINFGQAFCPLPEADYGSNPVVLVYPVDLISAHTCYATTGTAPNRTFTVTWKAFFYESRQEVMFSADLVEGTNVINVHVQGGGTLEETTMGKQHAPESMTHFCFQVPAMNSTWTYNP